MGGGPSLGVSDEGCKVSYFSLRSSQVPKFETFKRECLSYVVGVGTSIS